MPMKFLLKEKGKIILITIINKIMLVLDKQIIRVRKNENSLDQLKIS